MPARKGKPLPIRKPSTNGLVSTGPDATGELAGCWGSASAWLRHPIWSGARSEVDAGPYVNCRILCARSGSAWYRDGSSPWDCMLESRECHTLRGAHRNSTFVVGSWTKQIETMARRVTRIAPAGEPDIRVLTFQPHPGQVTERRYQRQAAHHKSRTGCLTCKARRVKVVYPLCCSSLCQ